MDSEVVVWRETAKSVLNKSGSYDWDNEDLGVRQLLEMAAAKHDPESVHLLAMLYCGGELNYYPYDKEEFRSGYEWLKSRVESGDPEAQCQYANVICYADGPYLEKAIHYWEMAYEGGVKTAALDLSDLYADTGTDWGVDYIPDLAKACHWLERAGATIDPMSADRYGELLYREIASEFAAAESSEQVEALKRSEKFSKLVSVTNLAAKAGCACSLMRLAAMRADGWVGEYDEMEIRELLLDAERSGSSVAHDCVDDILNKKITAKEAVGQYRSRIS